MKFPYKITSLLLLSFYFGTSQERQNDTINNQVVNVIRPYIPTISDAFKIKEVPVLEDAITTNKKAVTYNIFSIPVASTFTPAKGKAATIDKVKSPKLYDNFASLGFGSYLTVLGDLYLNHDISNTDTVGGYVSHHSSQGGINDLLVDDDFLNTSANAYYAQNLRNLSWKVDANFNIQRFNWYGIPQVFYDQDDANTIDSANSFSSIALGGVIDFNDALVKNARVNYRRFGDDQDSAENRLKAHINIDIPVSDYDISAEVFIDYLSGSFENTYDTNIGIDYRNSIIGVVPNYKFVKDDLSVDIGAKVVYFNDAELGDSKFFVYPNIEASYPLVQDIVEAYAGVTGELAQNSYYDFVSENPFVSPTLFISPTDQQYNGFVGFKGKLSNSVGYNIKGNYMSEKAKPLFKINTALNNPFRDYQFGNSFGVVYDDVTTLVVAGELLVKVNNNLNFGVKASYFNYNTDTQAEAWNLPELTGSVFADITINEQWFANASLFYVGERQDELMYTGLTTGTNPSIITLDSYLDANFHIGYHINDRWTVFAKGHNVLNQDYERWLNFPVQGIQFLAGATYKFDF